MERQAVIILFSNDLKVSVEPPEFKMSSLFAKMAYVECKSPSPEVLHDFYKSVLGFEVSPPQPIPQYLQVKMGNCVLMGFRKSETNHADKTSKLVLESHTSELLLVFLRKLCRWGVCPLPLPQYSIERYRISLQAPLD